MFEVDSETLETIARVTKGSATAFDPAGYPDLFIHHALEEPLTILQIHSEGIWNAERENIPGATKIRTAINTGPSVNALAYRDDNFRLVSLNVGMYIRVRQLMWQATHNTKVFTPRPNEQELRPELLADSSSKFSPKWLIEPVLIRPGLDDDFYLKMLTPVAPTVERVFLAETLTRSAMNFIILHEFGHVIRNQASFLPDRRSALFMEARQDYSAPISEEDLVVRRLLEVDADLAAIDLAFVLAGKESAVWADWTDNPREAASLWIISVALVFWLFQACDTSLGSRAGLHPSPLTRIMTLAVFLADKIPGLNLLDADDIIPFTMLSIEAAALIWDDFGLSREPSFSKDAAFRALSEIQEIAKGLDLLGIRTQRE